MDVATIEMPRGQARQKWEEYRDGCKDHPDNQFYKDMKKIYHALGQGRKLTDINKVIKKGGLNHQLMPRLSIARADSELSICQYNDNGDLQFYSGHHRRWSDGALKRDIFVQGQFPELEEKHKSTYNDRAWDNVYRHNRRLSTTLPEIPPSVYPKGKLDNYYILWEVEEWAEVPEPPGDPWLLHRLEPGNMFVVLAGWDLTELERTVVAGRMS